MLKELSFRVAGEDNLVCQFTRMHPATLVVINPLRDRHDGRIERAIYTIQAPLDKAQTLVEKHFEEAYGGYQVVSQREEALTVEVPMRLPKVGPGSDPLHMALDLLGADAFFMPLVVEDGYIHCTLVSPSPEGIKAFVQLVQQVNEQLEPETFQLLHVGPWNPTPSPPSDDRLTERQQDVLRLAVAMDYYAQPRGTTLDELADLLGISKAAVHKTLAAAENKVIKEAVGAV